MESARSRWWTHAQFKLWESSIPWSQCMLPGSSPLDTAAGRSAAVDQFDAWTHPTSDDIQHVAPFNGKIIVRPRSRWVKTFDVIARSGYIWWVKGSWSLLTDFYVTFTSQLLWTTTNSGKTNWWMVKCWWACSKGITDVGLDSSPFCNILRVFFTHTHTHTMYIYVSALLMVYTLYVFMCKIHSACNIYYWIFQMQGGVHPGPLKESRAQEGHERGLAPKLLRRFGLRRVACRWIQGGRNLIPG